MKRLLARPAPPPTCSSTGSGRRVKEKARIRGWPSRKKRPSARPGPTHRCPCVPAAYGQCQSASRLPCPTRRRGYAWTVGDDVAALRLAMAPGK